eukprot:1954731-Rhodomonas_salina.1
MDAHIDTHRDRHTQAQDGYRWISDGYGVGGAGGAVRRNCSSLYQACGVLCLISAGTRALGQVRYSYSAEAQARAGEEGGREGEKREERERGAARAQVNPLVCMPKPPYM